MQDGPTGVRYGQYLNENNNFDDFWNAIKYLIQLACGMDWMPLACESLSPLVVHLCSHPGTRHDLFPVSHHKP